MGCNCGKSKKGAGLVVIKDYESRMFICRQCPYSKDNKITGLTCGTLLKPTYDEDKKQLKSLDKLSPLSENYKLNKRVKINIKS